LRGTLEFDDTHDHQRSHVASEQLVEHRTVSNTEVRQRVVFDVHSAAIALRLLVVL
jgi:hypothetical protein